MLKRFGSSMRIGLVLVLAVICPGRVLAGAEASVGNTALGGGSGGDTGLFDSMGVAAFVDGQMESYLEQMKIPGAVVAIVKDGKVLYAHGYGYSDLEKNTKIDPQTSLFRIASTTKLFTWTAVMQLVEEGKLDLDTDVNSYLRSVKVPGTYPQPITLRHLMTHTAGFENNGVGYEISVDPAHLPSISAALAKHLPARVRPPGVMSAYSNEGAALAGLIVEEVSGLPYDEYIQKNIFDRLGMRYATVREPLPAPFQSYLVTGYAREGGVFVTQPMTYEGGFRPAGSASVSALDMARFMIAHLQEGRYGDTRILRPDTARLMHTTAFVLDKRLPGMDLGFYEQEFGSVRTIGHGGSDPLFNTELYLAPREQIGIFVSCSGGNGSAAAEGLTRAFFNRYFPSSEAPRVASPPHFATVADKYAGTYHFTRRSVTKIDKIYDLPSQLVLSVAGDRLALGDGDDRSLFAPIGTDLFQQVGGSWRIAFRTNAAGEVTHLFLDSLPFMPLERAPVLDSRTFWLPVLAILGVLFVCALIGFACRWRELKAQPRSQRLSRWLLMITSAWCLATLVVGVLVLMTLDVVTKLSRITESLQMFLLMPWILLGLTGLLLVAAFNVWKNQYWRLHTRIFYTLIAAAAVVMSVFLYHWNLIGWKFG